MLWWVVAYAVSVLVVGVSLSVMDDDFDQVEIGVLSLFWPFVLVSLGFLLVGRLVGLLVTILWDGIVTLARRAER